MSASGSKLSPYFLTLVVLSYFDCSYRDPGDQRFFCFLILSLTPLDVA